MPSALASLVLRIVTVTKSGLKLKNGMHEGIHLKAYKAASEYLSGCNVLRWYNLNKQTIKERSRLGLKGNYKSSQGLCEGGCGV